MKKLLLLLLVSSTALADDAGLLRCRGITDASARLACYDALPVQAGPQAPVRETPEQFGLQRQVTTKELDTIQSYIPGHFETAKTGEIYRLANGQVWQITEGNNRLYDLNNPKVTLRRGMLGSFFLDLEGDNRSLRVKRLQ